MKILQSRTILKQRNNHEVFYDYNFCIKFFTAPNSKNITETLYIVTVTPELTFFLIL